MHFHTEYYLVPESYRYYLVPVLDGTGTLHHKRQIGRKPPVFNVRLIFSSAGNLCVLCVCVWQDVKGNYPKRTTTFSAAQSEARIWICFTENHRLFRAWRRCVLGSKKKQKRFCAIKSDKISFSGIIGKKCRNWAISANSFTGPIIKMLNLLGFAS
eukprot:g56468.t1